MKKYLTFDDVLLEPKYSSILSRDQIDLKVNLGKSIELAMPIISANMKHVTEISMAKAVASMGGLAILHRFCSADEQIAMFKEVNIPNNTGVSIGLDINYADKVINETETKIVCVDIAHAHSKNGGDITNYIAKKYPQILLISGNIATKKGAQFLVDNGADVIKCGIGGGSICTTRTNTGNGVPQLSALINCKKFNTIADGGLRTSGDIVKALCFARTCMLGNLLAGTDEAPGSIIEIHGKKYKHYDGSSTFKNSYVEGVKSMVEYKGPVEIVIKSLLDGIKSGCSYQNAYNLDDLRKNPKLIKITNSGLKESNFHDVIRR